MTVSNSTNPLAARAVESIIHVFESLDDNEDGAVDRYRQKLLPLFSGFTDNTLVRISESLQDSGDDDDVLQNAFLFACLMTLANANAEEKHFTHLLQMRGIIESELQVEDPEDLVSLCLALGFYDTYVLDHNEKTRELPPEDRTAYYWALLGTTIVLEEVMRLDQLAFDRGEKAFHPDYEVPVTRFRVIPALESPLIEDPDLVALIIKHVDRIGEINEFIAKRRETSAELIALYLSNAHTALAEGTL